MFMCCKIKCSHISKWMTMYLERMPISFTSKYVCPLQREKIISHASA
jgi:hypothetical protein